MKERPVILCLDDHIDELAPHLTALEQKLNADICIAETVQDAEQLLQTHTVDLFILDIELSRQEGSGIRFAQRLRLEDRYRQTPVIFISMYSHYSRYVLSSVPHSTFLPKPFSAEALITKAGLLMGITGYAEQAYGQARLTIPARDGFVEVDAYRVSCIELIRSELIIRFIDGQTMILKSNHGCFKALLSEIDNAGLSHLRQIYRSVIINVHQIRQLTMQKNSGEVLLFYDDIPKPVGNRYRDRLAEFSGKE